MISRGAASCRLLLLLKSRSAAIFPRSGETNGGISDSTSGAVVPDAGGSSRGVSPKAASVTGDCAGVAVALSQGRSGEAGGRAGGRAAGDSSAAVPCVMLRRPARQSHKLLSM